MMQNYRQLMIDDLELNNADRTSFGGRIDTTFEDYLNEKRTYPLNALFGQNSIYGNKQEDNTK